MSPTDTTTVQPVFIPGRKPSAMRSRTRNNSVPNVGSHGHGSSADQFARSTLMPSSSSGMQNEKSSSSRHHQHHQHQHQHQLPQTPRLRRRTTAAMGDMTTVLVGRKRQAFVVNRRLLCAVSPFFREQLQQPAHPPPPSSRSSHALASSCPFPSPLSRFAASASSSSASSSSRHGGPPSNDDLSTYKPITLWLPGESATMFSLFVEWLHAPASFRSYLDDTAAMAHHSSINNNTATTASTSTSSPSPLVDQGGAAAAAAASTQEQLLHWALIRLHLFASHLGLLALQDLAIDAIQDLYLRCDWDISTSVIAYLYTRCDAHHAVRLRRWAVAMVAFSLTVAWHMNNDNDNNDKQQQQQQQQQQMEEEDDLTRSHPQQKQNYRQRTASSSSLSSPSSAAAAAAVCDPARLHNMLRALPEFAADYVTHVRGMRAAGLDMRFKNPQLRIPANTLRNEKRVFGFRECSFHSHRATVGQAPCPHAASGWRTADAGSIPDWEAAAAAADDDVDDVDDDDDTRQWEKEWADDYLDFYYELSSDYSYETTTSLRPPPQPEQQQQRQMAKPLLASRFGSHNQGPPVRDVSGMLSTSV